MELIKKNILLFIILAIAVLISAFLLLKVIQKKGGLDDARAKLEDLKSKVKQLTDEKPAPIQENLDRIQKDTESLEGKLSEINKVFCNPYRKPLGEFAKNLLRMPDADPDKAYDEIRERWRKFWNQEGKTATSPQMLLVKFFAELEVEVPKEDGTKEKIKVSEEEKNKAMEIFKNALETDTVEQITDTTLREILMEALGLPRQTNSNTCKQFIVHMWEQLNRNLQMNKVLSSEEVKKFTFGEYLGLRLPPDDQIPKIVRHWKMLEDLVNKRIIPAKSPDSELMVTKLTRKSLDGTRDKEFLYFRYTIELNTSLKTIRKLIDNLQKAAAEDNRVYVVKDIKIEKMVDEVRTLGDKTGPTSFLDRAPTVDFNELRNAEDEEYKEKIKDIGKVIIGVDNTVKAVIEFDYVIYIGNDLNPR